MYERLARLLRTGFMRHLSHRGWSRLGFTANEPVGSTALAKLEAELARQLPSEYREFLARWNGASLFIKDGEAGIRVLPVEEVSATWTSENERYGPGEAPSQMVPIVEIQDVGYMVLDMASGQICRAFQDVDSGKSTCLWTFAAWLDEILSNAQHYHTWHWWPRKEANVFVGLSLEAFANRQTPDHLTRRRLLCDLSEVLRPLTASVGIGFEHGELAETTDLRAELQQYVSSMEPWGNSRGFWLWCPGSDAVFHLLRGSPAEGHATRYPHVALRAAPSSPRLELLYHHNWGESGWANLTFGEVKRVCQAGWRLRQVRSAKNARTHDQQ